MEEMGRKRKGAKVKDCNNSTLTVTGEHWVETKQAKYAIQLGQT
jgi:hypothetical protein